MVTTVSSARELSRLSFTYRQLAASDGDAQPASTIVTSDSTRALYEDNYPRLQIIKKKYDPDVVFNQWYTITPA